MEEFVRTLGIHAEEGRHIFLSMAPRGRQSPSILAYAVDLKVVTALNEASDILRFERKALLGSGGIQVGPIITGQLGGREFEALVKSFNGMTFTTYVTEIKGYALMFIIEYRTDQAFAEIKTVLDTIQFD